MDEDDYYSAQQDYENELYRNQDDESGSDDLVDSDLEDEMLSHIHYSTNVYKNITTPKATTEGTKAEQEMPSTPSIPSSNGVGRSGQKANRLATKAEDYFQNVDHLSIESDSEEESQVPQLLQQRLARKKEKLKLSQASLSPSSRSAMLLNGNAKDQEDAEESRYHVEKKQKTVTEGGGDKSSAIQISGSDMSESDSSSDFQRQGLEGGEEEYESDERASSQRSGDDSDDEDQFANDEGDEGSKIDLETHVVDFGTMTNTDSSNFDTEAELKHLEDEDFKGKNRYYMEPDARHGLCHRCNQPGHMSRDCPIYKCFTCGAIGDHKPKDCPFQTCWNCRKKGHISEECPEQRGYSEYHSCHRCRSNMHATEDCPTVWRQYKFCAAAPQQELVQYCYNCSSLGHFGDRCQRSRPRFAVGVSAFNAPPTEGGSSSGSSFKYNYNSQERKKVEEDPFPSRSGSDRRGDSGQNGADHRHSTSRSSYNNGSSRSSTTYSSTSRTDDRNRDRRDSDRGGRESRESSSRHENRDRDRDQKRHSSSTKDRSHNRSGSDKDRERERERDHDRSSSSRHGGGSSHSRRHVSPQPGPSSTAYNMEPTTATGQWIHRPLSQRPRAAAPAPNAARPVPNNPPRPLNQQQHAPRAPPQSFAEQNAFPRSAPPGPSPYNNDPRNGPPMPGGMMGASSSYHGGGQGGQGSHGSGPPAGPGPRYTGGYSRRN